MIPTSTNMRLALAPNIPANSDGIVIFAARDQTPRGIEELTPADHRAVEILLHAGAMPSKSTESVVQVVAEPSPHRLIIIGLGDPEKLTAQTLREAGGAAAKTARKLKLQRLALISPHVLFHGHPLPAADAVHLAVDALATGLLLGDFQFREFKGAASNLDSTPRKTLHVHIISPEKDGPLHKTLERAHILADAQNLARTIASRPGNQINPPALADVAKKIARQVGLTCRVLDEIQLKRLGMGGLLAVGSGSATPPRLIVLQHRPKSKSSRPPILLVGKSITFDTGGVSIKPADKMGDMVYDKCGGMAVLGAMVALARTNHPAHVVGILTSAENHLSGTAYRPGDIIKLFNGVTVEVTNTDAEGRLVLADAIAWGIHTFKPSAVVDLATLTGGVVTALGNTIAGLMSNDDALAAALLNAAEKAGEKTWRLPVGDDHRNMLKGRHSDIINSAGRVASPLTGAAFLTFALPKSPATPWAHLDIAGVADTDKDLPLYTKGATGWGVRTLLAWLQNSSEFVKQ